jgi:hypothetical protein
MSENIGKREAFVALFDILGFQELVKNNQLDKVANAYSRVKEVFEDILSHVNALNKGFKMGITVDTHSFSDTFLIYTSDTSADSFLSLLAACDSLFIGAIENELLLRGAITYGELIISAGVEIGKPIVEAYESEKKQDWSGCWIMDQCRSKIDISNYLKDGSIVEYQIPFKHGQVKSCFAFNWVKSLTYKAMFENMKNDFTVDQIKEQVSFARNEVSDWAIRRKLDNTNRFVDFVLTPEFIALYKTEAG